MSGCGESDSVLTHPKGVRCRYATARNPKILCGIADTLWPGALARLVQVFDAGDTGLYSSAGSKARPLKIWVFSGCLGKIIMTAQEFARAANS